MPDNQRSQWATKADLEKFATKWEVRALVLAALVIPNTNIPSELTTGAAGLYLLTIAGKAVLAFFTRS